MGDGVRRVRALVADVIWAVAVVPAVVLALGALLVALEANTRNDAVRSVLRAADVVDLGVFSRTNGIKEFTGGDAAVRNVLVNWGLGAVAWLVGGHLLSKVVRP